MFFSINNKQCLQECQRYRKKPKAREFYYNYAKLHEIYLIIYLQ